MGREATLFEALALPVDGALVAGDLDHGLVPRENGSMSYPLRRKKMTEALASDREKVLLDELASKEKALSAKEEELRRQADEIERLEETTNTLGKLSGSCTAGTRQSPT